jgi:hypothetical protein
MRTVASGLTLLAIVVACVHASAAIVNELDSSAFAYKYEMDTAPNNQDLDANGTDDWFDTAAPPVSGGFAANTAQNQLFRGDFTGSIWRTLNNPAAADWTFEIRVAKTGGTQGSSGWFGIAQANLNESNSSTLGIKDSGIVFNGTEYLSDTPFGDGNYHVIRIAHDAVDNALYAWANGTLLNDDLSTPIAGANGSSFDNSTFIGDYGGAFAGDYSIDYMRLHTSAVAPVPEPSLLATAGAAGVAAGLTAVRRRRRRIA